MRRKELQRLGTNKWGKRKVVGKDAEGENEARIFGGEVKP